MCTLCPYMHVTFVCKNKRRGGGSLCISKCTRCCVNTPTPPLSLVPSAQLQQANYSRQSLLSPHSFFFVFFYPAAPLCPCPLPPTLLTARLATARRRNELHCIWERERVWKEEGGDSRCCWWVLLHALMEIVAQHPFGALLSCFYNNVRWRMS